MVGLLVRLVAQFCSSSQGEGKGRSKAKEEGEEDREGERSKRGRRQARRGCTAAVEQPWSSKHGHRQGVRACVCGAPQRRMARNACQQQQCTRPGCGRRRRGREETRAHEAAESTRESGKQQHRARQPVRTLLSLPSCLLCRVLLGWYNTGHVNIKGKKKKDSHATTHTYTRARAHTLRCVAANVCFCLCVCVCALAGEGVKPVVVNGHGGNKRRHDHHRADKHAVRKENKKKRCGSPGWK